MPRQRRWWPFPAGWSCGWPNRRGIPKDKIVLIHDAVDPELFQPRASCLDLLRQQYHAGEAVLVGMVGRVEEAKEQLGFVQIAGEVLKRTNRAAFFIIGDIKDRSYHARLVRQIRASGLTGHVHFTGRRDDIAEVLAGLDVLVSLSGGSVRYEAMMCGLPVICAWSRRPEESYCIRHHETGFLVSDRSIDAVSRVLLDLAMDGDLRRQVGRNARAWAQARLTDAVLVADTQSLYERLLSPRRQHVPDHATVSPRLVGVKNAAPTVDRAPLFRE